MIRFAVAVLLLALPAVSFAQVDETRPTLSVSIGTTNLDHERARLDDTITVTVVADEAIIPPRILIAGNDTSTNAVGLDGRTYRASVRVSDLDPEGTASVTVSDFEDMEGNPGFDVFTTTDGSFVVIDKTEPVAPSANVTFEATSALGATFALSDVSDALDGDLVPICNPLLGSVLSLGAHAVTCTVADRAGNEGTSSFTATVVDTTPPVITLAGEQTIRSAPTDTFTDPGASASDAVDSAVAVSTSGVVDPTTPGTYTITYSATDTHSNTASVTRTVIIESVSVGGGGGSSRSRANTDEEEEVQAASEEEPGGELGPTEGEVLGAAAYNFARHLKRGDTGTDVTELQKFLKEKGYFSGETTDYFGPLTEAALKAFQAANGLEAVGFVGPRTLALLNQGATSPTLAQLLLQLEELKAKLKALTSV